MSSRRSSTVLAALALTALVCVALVAWKQHTSRSFNQNAFIGDSITDQVRSELATRFDVDDSRVQAVPGRTIDEMASSGRHLAELQPRQVFINLGTNDVMKGEPTDQNATVLLELAGAYDRSECVHIVTVNESIFSIAVNDAHGLAVGLNQRIRAWASQQAAEGPKRRVIDWARIVSEYDASGSPGGPITYDTVHPTSTGRSLLLGAYQRSLDSCKT